MQLEHEAGLATPGIYRLGKRWKKVVRKADFIKK